MLNSFKYMFAEKDFFKKFLYLFMIILCSNILINWSGTLAPNLNGGKTSVWYYIIFLIGFIVMFIPYGYSISLLKNTIENGLTSDSPKIDIINNFISGFKVVISGSVLLLLLALIIFLVSFISAFLSSMLGIVVQYVFNAIVLLILFMVFFMGIAMCCRYVIKPSFLNFVNFKAVAELINKDTVKYSKAFLMSVLCAVIIYLITFLLVSVLSYMGYAGLIIYCVCVSILWTYQIYVFAGLFSHAVNADSI